LGGFRRCSALWHQAQRAEMDLVHSYGLWTDVNRLAGILPQRRRLPHVLAPCGMLAPGAMRHHGWKKVPVRFWFQDRALREANVSTPNLNRSTKTCAALGCAIRWRSSPIRWDLDHGTTELRDNGTTGKEQRAEVGGQKSVVSGPWSVVPWSVVHGSRTVLFLGDYTRSRACPPPPGVGGASKSRSPSSVVS